MATLNPRISNCYFSAKDGSFHESQKGITYSTEEAVDNLIHYVTRTGKRVDRKDDLIGFGCTGVSTFLTPEDYIRIFHLIQQRIRGDRDLQRFAAHEILTFSDNEKEFLLNNREKLLQLARRCAEQTYYNEGFLAVFGIHYGVHSDNEEKNMTPRLHIHFIINTVNHLSGNLFYSHFGNKAFTFNGGQSYFHVPYDTKKREAVMNNLLYEIMERPNPFEVQDPNDYIANAYKLYPRRKLYMAVKHSAICPIFFEAQPSKKDHQC